MCKLVIALSLGALLLTACGQTDELDSSKSRDASQNPAGAVDPPRPVPRIGRSARYRLPASKVMVGNGRPVGSLRCTGTSQERFGVHLEVFANRLDVVIPAGIGVSPPRIGDGAYVRSGRCSYQLRTLEPTGLIEV